MDNVIGKWTPAGDDWLPSEHEVRSRFLFSDRVGRAGLQTLCGREVRIKPEDLLDEPSGSRPSCNTCLLIDKRRAA
jgi:hypothetical protein